MPAENVIFLATVVVAFTLFAAVLTYVGRIAARRPDSQPAE